jgi:DNA replication and repair protein RecF
VSGTPHRAVRLIWIDARDFRNHRETRLDVPDGLVAAVGGNGEGKTNLLEAMYYGLTLGSPRSSSDQPLVRRGADVAVVRCEADSASGRALIEVEIRQAGANRVQLNRSPLRRRRDIKRVARAVFFSPGDLDVVQGDPDARRGFMDEAVATLWPVREPTASAYERVLRQRNRLLKDWEGGGVPSGLEAWDAELVEAGTALMMARAEAVDRVGPIAHEEFAALTGYGLEVRYAPSVVPDAWTQESVAGAFGDRLAARRADELVRRVTLVGPHRDELSLEVHDLTARTFASHGEAWAAAVALRLGQARAIDAELGEPPVLLLDDPFPGLDPARQRRLAGRVAGRGQTVLSVADQAHVPDDAVAVWEVAGGRVTPREAA